jgi:hypothetical protein
VANAAWGAGIEVKELRLIGEVHRLVEPAIAEAECVIQFADCLADPLRAVEWPVVDLRVVRTGPTHNQQLRRGTPGELDEGEVARVTLHGHVEPWSIALDQPKLLEQRRELAGRVVPFDAIRFAHDARALVRGKLAAEVREQSRTQLL